jgi:hypothetical protein
VVPGGQSAAPRVQGEASTSADDPVNTRRAPREQLRTRPSEERLRTRPSVERLRSSNGNRSEERLTDLRGTNLSMLSLGQLGQIMESDPVVEEPAPVPQRRRRRIVRGEEAGGLARRLTVTSREEGRAIGLARGASMRRLNVWDGE